MIDLNAIRPVIEKAVELLNQAQNNLGTRPEMAATQAQQSTAAATIAAAMALTAIAETLQTSEVHVVVQGEEFGNPVLTRAPGDV